MSIQPFSSDSGFSTAGNITANNIGNVAAINLSGNASTVLAGDGTWVAQSSGNGGVFTNGLDAQYTNVIATTALTGFANFDTGNGSPSFGTNSNANVIITTNAGTAPLNWIFSPTGNLTLPGNTSAINYANGTSILGGGSYGDSNVVSLLSAYGSNTVSTTGNVTSGNFLTGGVVSATGNVRGSNLNTAGDLSVTGNATVSGTSSNLTRRAYGLVAADVNVTLDDLSANVTSSTSQLALSTTGGWQGTGWTETFTSGTPSVSQWVNLPLSSGFTSASGAMVSQGQGCRCVISDQTPSAKVYQITVVRSGTTGAQWNISIERLV